MRKMMLKAYSVTNELDLNKVAILRGIRKKYTWEEPLILQGNALNEVLEHEISEDQKVFLFSFGSVIFLNFSDDQIRQIMTFLNNYLPGIDIENYTKYADDYELRINPDENYEPEEESLITDAYIVVKNFEDYMPEVVSTVIAKSVALERIEEQMSQILDSIESVIEKLERGKLKISSREHAKIISKVVRHEHNTISYIMILDRPDITWAKSEAGEMYDTLSDFFELVDRYEILRKKIETMNSIIDNFTSISNTIRGLFVEWVIVALILFDIVFSFFKEFVGK